MDIKEILSSKVSLIPKELMPAISFGLIIAAFILIFVFFMICVAYINAKPKPVIKRDDKKSGKTEVVPAKIRHEDLPIISGRIGEFLTLLGVLNAGPVTKIFFKVLEIMKNSTYDIRWRYKLPCFLLTGPDGSGKSTLVDSLNFEHLAADVSAVNSMWKLFQNGAIFELPRMDSSENISKFWSFIGELFIFIRPRRPLDGIILTLPADMLLSDAFDIEKHSREMFEKIFQFQRDVNFRLPIYLIITKMDMVSGFSEFSHFLNDNAKQQIFGWSCPHSIGSAFSTGWISEIFQTISEGIRKAILNFSKEKKISGDLEQAILFEYNINNIKSSLTRYLHSMFQSHNPEDGLLLRGVYFVGRQKQVDLVSAEIVRPSALSPNTNLSFNNSYNDNLYFVQDLFKEKIFKEYNIAYPIRINAIDMNQTEQRNKIVMAVGSTIAALGWFWGNNHIKEKIHEYYLSMTSIKTIMKKIQYLEKNLKGEEDQALINKQAIILLKNIPTLNRFSLFSIFVPQSWFSNLRKEMLETIGLVFDSVIIRAMYIDINMNIKNMLRNIPDNLGALEKKKDLFNIDTFASFQRLREFVKQSCDIERVSGEYNVIRQLEDRKSVADLTSTLFKENFNIADEVKNRVPNKKLIPPKFDIAIFREKIESNLRTIFAAFLNDVLDVTVEKILQSVVQDIDRILEVSRNPALHYSVKDLAKMYGKTLLVVDILKNKNFLWISSDHFAPCPEYSKLMTMLKASSVVGDDCIRELIKTGEVEFHKFKSRLLGYETKLTGKLLSSDIRTVSVGFDNFQKEIQSILDQSFIRTSFNGQLITSILEDKMLIWDLKQLKELTASIDKYYEFSENMPPNMRAQFFDMYKIIARKCFYPIIDSMLGSAQIFDDIPLGHSRDLMENAYKRQAANIRNASFALPKIAKILDDIQEEDNSKDLGFSSMIVSQYETLLERVDALFNQEKPYSAEHAVFDNWNGDKTPQYLDIDSAEELRQYLTAQFGRIRFLAKDLASPVVDILTMPCFIERVKNRPMLNKWKEIISNVDAYESKKPGNSIAALESFISESLSKISIDSFDEQGEIKTISQTKGDYFLSKRSDVATSLLSRADAIKYEQAANSYEKINKFFNANLAKKFPFGKFDQDASLKDIENYVNLYEQNMRTSVDILKRNRDNRKISNHALEFLDSMNDKLIPFLKTWISHSKMSDANSALVSFNVQARPSPDLEALTSSVMDRELLVDNLQIADNANFIFFNGNKVDMVFKWVASSDEKPYEKGASGNLLIKGTEATFSYAGKWALFRMIEENKINSDTESPGGVLLQLNVPIVDASKRNALLSAKMIVKITPMSKDGDKVSPMAWPVFPESCPNLHEDVPENIFDATIANQDGDTSNKNMEETHAPK
ncbi:MAG: hypothetical protein LBG04_02965 [Holosporaceae bacterium]|jgi:type VI secretion system protein ImpL|nr:hypothetical protein [Holosporaceae bacterium]